MADQKEINPICAIVELARDAQLKQTKEVLQMIKDMPQTPEIELLKERLRIADLKINKQLDFILRVDRIAKKYA